MFSFSVKGKEYKVRYGYRILCETNILDRLSSLGDGENANELQNVMMMVADMVLAGLQKHHRDEFGYETDTEKKAALSKVYDLMDDYEDESTEENQQDCFTLFEALQEELTKNGFLSRNKRRSTLETAEAVDATVIPQDHKAGSK